MKFVGKSTDKETGKEIAVLFYHYFAIIKGFA